jgi:Arc/MetJ-type ribon-helix-helix transcriptional regulator
MVQKRTHISIPEEILAGIDQLVGKGQRSALVSEILESEVRRRLLLKLLDEPGSAWKDEDHPELKDGAYAHIRGYRDESNKRLEQQTAHWGPHSE